MGSQLSKYFEGGPPTQGLWQIFMFKNHSPSCPYLIEWTDVIKVNLKDQRKFRVSMAINLISLKQSWVGGGLVTKSCLTPDSCDPMDCSLQGSSVHGIPQARILESDTT